MHGCFGGAKGFSGGLHALICRQDDKRTRNSKKKIKTSTFTVVKKWIKTGKRENNRKIVKKKRKRDKKTEQEEQHEAKVPTSQGAAKKQAETTKTWSAGDISTQKNLQ